MTTTTTTQTFLQKVEASVDGAIAAAEADVKAAAAYFLPEAEADIEAVVTAAEGDLEQLLKIGAPIALAAVLAQAPKVADGEEKLGAAVTSTAEQLETAIGPVAIGDVQTLVQATYQKVKAQAQAAASKLAAAA